MTRTLIVLAIVVAGCSTLDDLDSNVCGNGIVEPGEDCDSSTGCVACGIQCTTTAACIAFDGSGGTAGFVCGADGLCHAPAGTFHPPSELTVAVDTVRVADVDHDRIGDLLIQSPTALHVSLGNPDGIASLDTSILTPIARGPASYADLDLDGTTDLLLPTSDGIAAFTSQFGVMSPFPFPSLIDESMGVPLFAHPIDPLVLGFVGTQGPTDDLKYLVLRVDVGGAPAPLAPVCGAKASQFSAAHVDVFDVAPGHQIIAVTLDPTGAPRVCLLAVDRQLDQTYLVTPIAAPPSVPDGRAVLARLRGGGCPSLVMRTAGSVVEYRPAAATNPCSFVVATPVTLNTPAGSAPIGWLPLVPPRAGASFALVLSTGVFAFNAGVVSPVYFADRPLALVQFADLDGDTDVDLVATARDPETGAALEDIDVLYRAPNGMPDGFVRYRFDTDGPVQTVQFGDYDGNAILDLLFVQTRVQGGTVSEDLAIAYGTRDQLLPGASVGSFQHVISVLPTNFPDSNDQTNLVSDVAVLFESSTGKQVSLLHGSPQRTMLGYFDPRPPLGGPQQRSSLFRGVVGGRFRSATSTAGLDLVAVDAVDTAVGPGLAFTTELWFSKGPTGGNVEQLEPVAAPDLARCDAVPPAGNPFCIGDARYVAWPMPDATDRVIGVDPKANAITFHASDVDPTTKTLHTQPWVAGKLVAPDGTRVRQIDVAALDDGPRLVVSFAPAPGSPATKRAVALCDIDGATGQATACTDLGALITQQVPEDTWSCADAAPARVAPFKRFDDQVAPTALVVLCRGSGVFGTLFQVTVGSSPAATRLLDVLPADELRIGDVSGDGIDDLITIGRGSATPTLRIYTQCTSRDRCDVNSAVEAP